MDTIVFARGAEFKMGWPDAYGDKAKTAQEPLSGRYGIVSDIGMGVTEDEGAQVARPDIVASQFAGQINYKALPELQPVVSGFVMRAHRDEFRSRSLVGSGG